MRPAHAARRLSQGWTGRRPGPGPSARWPPGSFPALAVSKGVVPGPHRSPLEEAPHVSVRLRLFTDDEWDWLAVQEVTTAELGRERAIRFFVEAEARDRLLIHDDVAWLAPSELPWEGGSGRIRRRRARWYLTVELSTIWAEAPATNALSSGST